uniref:Uncharacterized protein n=1 Tax=Panagrolaimus davidi TaxID=227884 RepID=A0A914Q1J8_9BILA
MKYFFSHNSRTHPDASLVSGSGNGVFGPPTGPVQREITCSTPGDPTGGYTFIDNAPSQQIVTSVFCT